MDGLTVVANQFPQLDAVVTATKPDPVQIAEFERLMQESKTGQSTLDVYTPRVESTMDALSAAMLRTGKQISATFLEQSEAAFGGTGPVDMNDPAAFMDRALHMQKGLMHAAFQLQFATSLVESANKGISTLFHMQG